MRWTRTFIPTLREEPAGITHPGIAALVRGGYLRQAGDTGYVYLPLFNRVRQKLFSLLEHVLEQAGGLPVDLAVGNPEHTAVGAARLTSADRRRLICGLVGRELRSYRRLPLVLYLVDRHPPEEFPSKAPSNSHSPHDWLASYTFASTSESFAETQVRLAATIRDCLAKLGLPTVQALVRDGVWGLFFIGNNFAGPEVVFCCKNCAYAAIGNAAAGRPTAPSAQEPARDLERVATPGARTVEEVTAFLDITADRLIKTLLYKSESGVIAALVRGDRQANEEKLCHTAGVGRLELLAAPEVFALSGAPVGFSGPVGLTGVRIIADSEIPLMKNAVVGGNAPDIHLINVNPGAFAVHQVADIRQAQSGDGCPQCARGELAGHPAAFLGEITPILSGDVLPVLFDNEQGREAPAILGEFHLDLTEVLLLAAAIRRDACGLKWAAELAPYDVFVLAVNLDDPRQRDIVERLEADLLRAGIDVLCDDRLGRVGGRFKDADLLGIPLRITVGPRGLAESTLDFQWRNDGRIEKVGISEAAEIVRQYVRREGRGCVSL